ncbi:RNA polymerase sigma factor SigZ [Flavihumibacter sp. UBA7668]|uniref:RNA polymerase sigma factor SigZ n=1 Tax=Flavihumibacter sp. UBA7668 TaxID=1946542 RepID=UPI0025C57E72|nr:RNA polymerase sigma factor SigZ [Flavihumibacter sp. UBA7668]
MELAAIYTRFYQVLLGFIKSKVNNHQDAEDILQNVFIKVAGGVGELNRKEKLQSWIYTISRNSIIDYYRVISGKKSISSEEAIAEHFTDEEYIDTTKGLDYCLLNFVKQLPEEYRDIIIDVELNGIKQKDLAEKYKLAYPSVRSRVQRGREKLKQILLDCCHIQWDNRGNILEVQSRSACAKDEAGSCKN